MFVHLFKKINILHLHAQFGKVLENLGDIEGFLSFSKDFTFTLWFYFRTTIKEANWNNLLFSSLVDSRITGLDSDFFPASVAAPVNPLCWLLFIITLKCWCDSGLSL